MLRTFCYNIYSMKKYLDTKKKPLFFRFLRSTLGLFYGKREFVGIENIPSDGAIFVGNHAQVHGPIACELYFPARKYVWCIGQMMKMKEVPDYAYEDFWSKKPKAIRWFFRMLSYIIAPLASYVFNHADTIGVYKDARGITTYKQSVQALHEGINLVIFPENRQSYNEIVNEFQDKFIDVARLYYKKHKRAVAFVPMYNAEKLKKIVFGKPIVFSPDQPIDKQRKAICDYIKSEITRLAKELPVHTVIPYDNIAKKNYPKSK